MIHLQQLIPRQQSTRDHIQLQRFDQNSIFRHSPKRKISKRNPNPKFLKYLFSPLPNPRRSNSNLRIKKSKNRSKFKFHVYEPSVKRKENYNNQNNKNVIQNYENRLKQQQTLLLEVSFTNAAIPPTLQPTHCVQSVRNSGVTFFSLNRTLWFFRWINFNLILKDHYQLEIKLVITKPEME